MVVKDIYTHYKGWQATNNCSCCQFLRTTEAYCIPEKSQRKAMKNAIVFLLLTWCTITSQDKGDLRGQVFSFPEAYASSYARLTPLVSKPLSSATICLRFFTDRLNSISLFSLNITGQPAALTISGMFGVGLQGYQLVIEDKALFFYDLPGHSNKWNSLCATWNGSTGMSQMVVNKMPSVRKVAHTRGALGANISVILGPGRRASFTGHITDVHIYDYVVSPSHIQNYMQDNFVSYTLGNYLNWRSVDYSMNGYVLVENINTLNSWR
ncbi:mucosal pentraxin-like [Sardina pilchardus]|uniref:mucosal pentraxin-like n=1 Tax=Sardina pilchardus TaxID=27697 RepID=UPI002E1473B3